MKLLASVFPVAGIVYEQEMLQPSDRAAPVRVRPARFGVGKQLAVCLTLQCSINITFSRQMGLLTKSKWRCMDAKDCAITLNVFASAHECLNGRWRGDPPTEKFEHDLYGPNGAMPRDFPFACRV